MPAEDPICSDASAPSAPRDPSLGIYIHFPWCLSKCPYCDFLSVAAERTQIPSEQYTEAVLRELEQRAGQLGTRTIHSVFFGGGTPSLWGAAGIGSVLRGVFRYFSKAETGVEITVECNPTSFSQDFARRLCEQGVDRVSLGVQSLDQARLSFLGRLHTPTQGLEAIQHALRAGVPRVSADLIFGVDGQTPEQAAAEASQLAQLGLSHISAYALTIEPGTQFGARHRKGTLPLLPEELVARSFVAVEQALAEHGLEHYEISNYAKPGQASLHNLGYWTGRQYLGLGAGAWGTVQLDSTPAQASPEPGNTRVRYRNDCAVDRYMNTIIWPSLAGDTKDAASRHQAFETLDAPTLLSERLMLGLRLAQGVDLMELANDLQLEVLTPRRRTRIERLVSRGQLQFDGTRIRIPSEQWLFADGIIAALV